MDGQLGSFRLADPPLVHYPLRPNATPVEISHEYRFEVRANALVFHDRGYPAVNAAGTFRILLLDSVAHALRERIRTLFFRIRSDLDEPTIEVRLSIRGWNASTIRSPMGRVVRSGLG